MNLIKVLEKAKELLDAIIKIFKPSNEKDEFRKHSK